MFNKLIGAFEWFSNSEYVTYVWMFLVSIFGGSVSYFDKHSTIRFLRFFTHLTSSAFAGLMTGMLCQYSGVNGDLKYVACGIAAHMGTPAVIALLKKNKLLRGIFEQDNGGSNTTGKD